MLKRYVDLSSQTMKIMIFLFEMWMFEQDLCMILPQVSFRFRLDAGTVVWLKNFVMVLVQNFHSYL